MNKPEVPLEQINGLFVDGRNRTIAKNVVQLFQQTKFIPMFDVDTHDFQRLQDEAEIRKGFVPYSVTYQPIDYGPKLHVGVEIGEKLTFGVIHMYHVMHVQQDNQLHMHFAFRRPFQEGKLLPMYILAINGLSVKGTGIDEQFTITKDTYLNTLSVRSLVRGLFGMSPVYQDVYTNTSVPLTDKWPDFCLSIGAVNLLDEPKIAGIFSHWPTSLSHLWGDYTAVQAVHELSSRIIEEPVIHD